MSHIDEVLLHVPRAGGAALRTEPAMQAHIFVLGHDAAGLEAIADIEVLAEIVRRRLQARAQVGFLSREERSQRPVAGPRSSSGRFWRGR